jgi:hypothetical protein
MSVHVGELHTEVVPAGDPGSPGTGARREPEWVHEQRVAEAQARVEWLRRRVSAEDFGD